MNISENEMVLAFLQAEKTSTRFTKTQDTDMNKLLFRADLSCASENKKRKQLLGKKRGYCKNKYIFEGFPQQVDWTREQISLARLAKAKYIKHPQPNKLTNRTRVVRDGVRNITKIFVKGWTENIFGIAANLLAGYTYPEIILVRDVNNELYVLEGHARITAHVWLGIQPDSCIVGNFRRKSRWTSRNF